MQKSTEYSTHPDYIDGVGVIFASYFVISSDANIPSFHQTPPPPLHFAPTSPPHESPCPPESGECHTHHTPEK